nr:MAG TPA: Repressor protein CI [Caudoviricetes sp.]
MYEIYCKLRDAKGLKDADVAKATGITKSTFSDWKSGRSKPNAEKLKKIADFLDTMTEYLDEQRGEIVTCPDCGMTYCRTCIQDVKMHKKEHEKWEQGIHTFGEIYANYPVREKIKAKNRNIRNNPEKTLEERYNAELIVLRCLFSRSVQASGYNPKHVPFEKYVAMIMNNTGYKKQLGDELYNKIVKNFGTLPGIENGKTYYEIYDDATTTVAAHKDNGNFTPEELKKIEEYKKLLIAARPKE